MLSALLVVIVAAQLIVANHRPQFYETFGEWKHMHLSDESIKFELHHDRRNLVGKQMKDSIWQKYTYN